MAARRWRGSGGDPADSVEQKERARLVCRDEQSRRVQVPVVLRRIGKRRCSPGHVAGASGIAIAMFALETHELRRSSRRAGCQEDGHGPAWRVVERRGRVDYGMATLNVVRAEHCGGAVGCEVSRPQTGHVAPRATGVGASATERSCVRAVRD